MIASLKAKQAKNALYIVTFFKELSFGLIATTYVLFMLSLGLNKADIGIINFSCFFTKLIFEIPSGAFADTFGRKKTFLLSSIFFFFGLLYYFYSYSFISCIISEIIVAIAMAMQSGCLNSWIVDLLNEENVDEKEIAKVQAKNHTYKYAGMLIGCFLGALISQQTDSLRLPWLFSSIVILIAFILALILIQETENYKNTKENKKIRSII